MAAALLLPRSAAVSDVGVGACGPGCREFDAEQFVMHRLGTGAYWRLDTSDGWWDWTVKRRIMSSYSSKLYPNCADGLLAKTRFCDSI